VDEVEILRRLVNIENRIGAIEARLTRNNGSTLVDQAEDYIRSLNGTNASAHDIAVALGTNENYIRQSIMNKLTAPRPPDRQARVLTSRESHNGRQGVIVYHWNMNYVPYDPTDPLNFVID
jgi:hypothetical protein